MRQAVLTILYKNLLYRSKYLLLILCLIQRKGFTACYKTLNRTGCSHSKVKCEKYFC